MNRKSYSFKQDVHSQHPWWDFCSSFYQHFNIVLNLFVCLCFIRETWSNTYNWNRKSLSLWNFVFLRYHNGVLLISMEIAIQRAQKITKQYLDTISRWPEIEFKVVCDVAVSAEFGKNLRILWRQATLNSISGRSDNCRCCFWLLFVIFWALSDGYLHKKWSSSIPLQLRLSRISTLSLKACIFYLLRYTGILIFSYWSALINVLQPLTGYRPYTTHLAISARSTTRLGFASLPPMKRHHG